VTWDGKLGPVKRDSRVQARARGVPRSNKSESEQNHGDEKEWEEAHNE
jgi:hypothetical protein